MVPVYQQPSWLETVPDGEEHLVVFLLQSPVLLGLVPGQRVECQGGHDYVERSTRKFLTGKVQLNVISLASKPHTTVLTSVLYSDST